MKHPQIRLDQIADIPQGAINPSKFPTEVFSLHSIPAYPTGSPEELVGIKIKSSKTLVRHGDVLISKLNPRIPRVWLVEKSKGLRQISSTEFIPFRVKDPDYVDPEYLAVMMAAPQFIGQLAKLVRSSTKSHQRIRPDDIKGHSVPIPTTLSEQIRIATRVKSCLEQIEEMKKLRAYSIREETTLLGSLIDSHLMKCAGEPARLGDVCDIVSKLVDPKKDAHRNKLHVGGANIQARTGRVVNLKTAAEEEVKSAKFTFNSHMILYNKIRPYLIKIARPDFNGLCSADMYPLTPDTTKISKDYLFFLLFSSLFTNYAIAGSNRAGMPKVNRKHLFNFQFSLPDLDVQEKVCGSLNDAISAVDLLQVGMDASFKRIFALKDALLSKAFVGEL